jgi:tetratricopeptide (TPR) repeat protein
MESTRLEILSRAAHKALVDGNADSAWKAISEMLNIDMDNPHGLYMAGVFMRQKGHSGVAAQLFRRCVSLETRFPNPWMNFGACLHDIHMYDEAIEVFEVLRKMIPKEPQVYANLAASHVQKGDFAQAMNYASEALQRNPEHRNAKAVKALACLGLERWKEGFADYSNMYGGQITIRTYCQPEEPEWDGTAGQTVVIQCDQGIGDEIRYASLLDELAYDCKQVILDCHPKLENVFKRSFPGIAVHGTKKLKEGLSWLANYKIDARYHISGLGRFYRKKNDDFPRKPYLSTNPDLRKKWKTALEGLPRPLVGLAWQGGSTTTGRELRSTKLSQWAPLVECGGTFVDLSYHDSAAEVNAFVLKGHIYRPKIDESDYEDTLALIAELDLVVCVPTTVMHAAGAIGKPVWVLVPPYTPWEFGLY